VLDLIGGPYRDRTCGPLIKRNLEMVRYIIEKHCVRDF